MPKVNLRLTDEEHALLDRWARDGHRSIQKELIFRLFSRSTAASDVTIARTSLGPSSPRAEREPEARAVPAQTAAAVDDHFKPDPKPARK